MVKHLLHLPFVTMGNVDTFYAVRIEGRVGADLICLGVVATGRSSRYTPIPVHKGASLRRCSHNPLAA